MTRLTAHLIRGATGAALLAWALLFGSTQPALAITAAVLAVVALRGCPTCWIFGLWDSIRHP
jgi:hypothetical protein